MPRPWHAKRYVPSRYYDDHEHELPWEFARFIWDEGRMTLDCLRPWAEVPEEEFMLQIVTTEMISWGDLGFFMCLPWPALEETPSWSQDRRTEGAREGQVPGRQATWCCMALTESHCGSDSSAIRTRAVQDGDSWI